MRHVTPRERRTPDEDLKLVPPEDVADLALGDRVRWVRLKKKLDQAQFAELIGVSGYRAVSRWERGRNAIKDPHAAKIAEAGDLPVDLFRSQTFTDTQRSFEDEVARLARLNDEYEQRIREVPDPSPPPGAQAEGG